MKHNCRSSLAPAHQQQRQPWETSCVLNIDEAWTVNTATTFFFTLFHELFSSLIVPNAIPHPEVLICLINNRKPQNNLKKQQYNHIEQPGTWRSWRMFCIFLNERSIAVSINKSMNKPTVPAMTTHTSGLDNCLTVMETQCSTPQNSERIKEKLHQQRVHNWCPSHSKRWHTKNKEHSRLCSVTVGHVLKHLHCMKTSEHRSLLDLMSLVQQQDQCLNRPEIHQQCCDDPYHEEPAGGRPCSPGATVRWWHWEYS